MTVRSSADPLPVINLGEPHILAVLLVDTSASMTGEPIEALNRGLVGFGQALAEEPLVFSKAEVCVISFNSSVQTEIGFRPAADYQAPTLSLAGGPTSLNEAIEAGLDAIESRKSEYRNQGVRYYRPLLFVLTDGGPTDTEKEAYVKNRLWQYISDRKIVYMPMAIGTGADTEKLREYYPEGAYSKYVLEVNASNITETFAGLIRDLIAVPRLAPNIPDQEIVLASDK